MFKKIVLCIWMSVCLFGCDNGESQSSASMLTPEQSISQTAIYLPSGVGIDFGVAPLKDDVLDRDGDVRVVIYLLDSGIADIDSELSAIFLSSGYKRLERPQGTDDLRVVYRNSSGGVLFRYKKQVSEGLVRHTQLTVTWRI